MSDIRLEGCPPEPMMNYLKALGVFRIVAEQADPDAKLSWVGGVALLQSKFTRDELLDFILNRWKPTPILAPWNGGSGFYGGGSEPLIAIENSTSDRLSQYRETIRRIRGFVPRAKPKDEDKLDLLIACRSNLADEVVPWLDVCFVLGEKLGEKPGEQKATFFPLLGTGGNDGRLDFTNNFMQRLGDVISFEEGATAPDESKKLLCSSLFADTLVSLGKTAIGQFNPGGIGGANGKQGSFEADSRVNPWDFVLMIEGALLFAGSVARRMGTNSSLRAIFPFSVESVAVGYGSATASEETTDGSRAELWLPIWSKGCTRPEVEHLFGEGRAQLGRRQAKNAVEFSLAVNLLGVNRGIDSFVRYGFLKRNGLAFLATPLGRVEVKPRPDARLLDDPQFVQWIDRLRRACNDKEKTPGRYQSVLRSIDRAIFAFSNRSETGNDAKYLLEVLRTIGRAERTLARGLKFSQEKYIRPLSQLNSDWLSQADDQSPEFRLAASIAGIRPSANGKVGPIRIYLEEVVMNGIYPNWSPGSTSTVWSNQPLVANLAAVFRRRQIEAYGAEMPGVPLESNRFARLDDVLSFLNAETDDEKIEDLIWGLCSVQFDAEASDVHRSDSTIPFEFGLPRLVVEEGLQIRRNSDANKPGWEARRSFESNVKPDPDVFHVLSSGRFDAITQSVTRAARRLKSNGLMVDGYKNRYQSGKEIEVVSSFEPVRLLASMLFPLTIRDLQRIANSVLYPPEMEQ